MKIKDEYFRLGFESSRKMFTHQNLWSRSLKKFKFPVQPYFLENWHNFNVYILGNSPVAELQEHVRFLAQREENDEAQSGTSNADAGKTYKQHRSNSLSQAMFSPQPIQVIFS